jgi:PEP-CTERM motif
MTRRRIISSAGAYRCVADPSVFRTIYHRDCVVSVEIIASDGAFLYNHVSGFSGPWQAHQLRSSRVLPRGDPMVSTRFLAASFFLALLFLVPSPMWAAATVNYQGFLYGGSFGPFAPFQPVVNGFVVAGTFAPGFNPSSIPAVYGDFAQNVGSDYYAKAVADGNIRPIGPGTLTDGTGHFSASGMTSDPTGTRIYLFGFSTPVPSNSGAFSTLGTSSDASFLVPPGGGITTVNASMANQFVFGGTHNNGISLDVLPFPEPSTFILAGVGFVALAAFAVRRRIETPVPNRV